MRQGLTLRVAVEMVVEASLGAIAVMVSAATVQVAAAHRTPLVLMGEYREMVTLQVAVMAAVQVAAVDMEGEMTEILAMVTVDQVG
jgi:hypothetical protein